MKKLFLAISSAAALLFSSQVPGTIISSYLTGYLNVDNTHLTELYKKTPTGDEFVLNITGNDWQTTSVISGWGLEQGVDYYLEFTMHDQGGIAGFIAELNLSGADHVFATNNATHLVSNNYDTAWIERITGNQSFSYGGKTASPWYGSYNDSVYGPTANWIWHTHAEIADAAAYRVEITSTYTPDAEIPIPSVLCLLVPGLFGLWTWRRQL